MCVDRIVVPTRTLSDCRHDPELEALIIDIEEFYFFRWVDIAAFGILRACEQTQIAKPVEVLLIDFQFLAGVAPHEILRE